MTVLTKYFKSFILFTILLFSISCFKEDSSNNKIIISIIKEDNEQKFNSIEKGLLDQISADDLNISINFYTSNGEDASIIQIANNVRDDNSTIAVLIGENSVLMAMNIIVPQSILFAGCFDHISLASIRKSKIQNNNITGVYKDLDITKYIKIISENSINSIGYLHTKSSYISMHISDDIKRYCNKENIHYYPILIDDNASINDIENIIKQTMEEKKIDYLILSEDEYIEDNIYSINNICNKYSIPMINTDIEKAIDTDILFSLDCNYYYLGRKLALLLKEVIKNKGKTDNIDLIEIKDSSKILINKDTAKHYNIAFTEEILKESNIIVENGSLMNK